MLIAVERDQAPSVSAGAWPAPCRLAPRPGAHCSPHPLRPRAAPSTAPTCFPDLHSQFGELALQDRLLLLRHAAFLLLSIFHLSALCTLQGLHFHGNCPILLLSCTRGSPWPRLGPSLAATIRGFHRETCYTVREDMRFRGSLCFLSVTRHRGSLLSPGSPGPPEMSGRFQCSPGLDRDGSLGGSWGREDRHKHK